MYPLLRVWLWVSVQVPSSEVSIEDELVRCLVLVLNTSAGQSALDSRGNLLPLLVVSEVSFRSASPPLPAPPPLVVAGSG